jgi:hypothetical protein
VGLHERGTTKDLTGPHRVIEVNPLSKSRLQSRSTCARWAADLRHLLLRALTALSRLVLRLTIANVSQGSNAAEPVKPDGLHGFSETTLPNPGSLLIDNRDINCLQTICPSVCLLLDITGTEFGTDA